MMATRRMIDFQANAAAIGGGMDLKGSGVYKMHRIHTTRLPSGVWVVSIVRLGVARDDARFGGGPPVERIRGEYRSQAEAVSAAKQYVDRGDTPPEIAVK